MKKSIKYFTVENRQLKLKNMQLTKTCQELQTRIKKIPIKYLLNNIKRLRTNYAHQWA